MASIPADTSPASTFDASRWLDDWTEHGGIYVLIGDHLHLRRAWPLDRQATSSLDRLRDQLLRSDGGPAIAEVLMMRRNGDVP